MGEKLKVAIIGSGNIGTDLLIKVLRSEYLECTSFIGRNLSSPGMMKAGSLGIPCSAESIAFIEKNPGCCDLVFDATSAKDHALHAPILKQLDKWVIDLTPAKIGALCVPAVNMEECVGFQNLNMVTCGGQASIPIAHALMKTQDCIDYIEVVSSIASKSAGPATRHNLDEYIDTTERALLKFSGAKRSKAILNLNPADPCINMQTTVLAKVDRPNLDDLKPEIENIVKRIQMYVPGYEIIFGPSIEHGRIAVMVRVRGRGDYLPAYAGNLDIINCAAVVMAETFAKSRRLNQNSKLRGKASHEIDSN